MTTATGLISLECQLLLLPCCSSPGNQATLSELCRSRQSRHFSHIADCALIRGSPATLRSPLHNESREEEKEQVHRPHGEVQGARGGRIGGLKGRHF